jgi:hypothetical protein
VTWDIRTGRELSRVKSQKQMFADVENFVHPRFSSGTALIYFKEDTKVRFETT